MTILLIVLGCVLGYVFVGRASVPILFTLRKSGVKTDREVFAFFMSFVWPVAIILGVVWFLVKIPAKAFMSGADAIGNYVSEKIEVRSK